MRTEATVFIVDDDPAVIRLVTELAGAIGLTAQILVLGRRFSRGLCANRAGVPGPRRSHAGNERSPTPKGT